MMTPFLCSVHTHSTLCDGNNTPEEMAAAACAAGVRYYGFSGHSHTPIPTDAGLTLPADLTEYRERVLRLREEYAGRMEILLGLEWDSLSDVEPEGLDYWIGSVHNQPAPNGTCYTTDWDETHFSLCIREGCGGDVQEMVRRYYEQLGRVAAKRPTLLGHFDGITKLNAGNCFFDQDALWYRALALDALHQADPEATLLEINTAGLLKKGSPYPALFLLEAWRAMGGEVILTADAHGTNRITAGYREGIALAQAAGFTRSVLLTAGGRTICPL